MIEINPNFLINKRLVIEPRSTALNLGCGAYVSDIAKQLKEIEFKTLYSVDIWPEYLKKIGAVKALEHIPVAADVRDFVTMLTQPVDYAFLFDILEHLPKEQGINLLSELKTKAKTILAFTPIEPEGFHRKNVEPENIFQDHVSYWGEEDFSQLGFKNEVIKNCHDEHYKDGSAQGAWVRFGAVWSLWSQS